MAVIFFSYPILLASRLAKYLKEKNATTENNAISFEDIDWKSFLKSIPNQKVTEEILPKFPYIKKTSTNKYWADANLYDQYIAKDKKWGLIAFSLFILLLIVFTVIAITS